MLKQLSEIQLEFKKYRQEKEIEDLLVVKLNVETIDEAMLTLQSTKVEDLENERAKLEAKILSISSEYHLALADKQ